MTKKFSGRFVKIVFISKISFINLEVESNRIKAFSTLRPFMSASDKKVSATKYIFLKPNQELINVNDI